MSKVPTWNFMTKLSVAMSTLRNCERECIGTAITPYG
jgi:hypothetical protein